ITSIFAPLLTGSAVVLYGGEYGVSALDKIIEEKRVEVVKLTPSHLKMIKDIEDEVVSGSSIKTFIVGGEELDTHLAETIHSKFKGNIKIYNEYGPTEATVGCMIHEFRITTENRRSVPIGIPAANTAIYLLDDNLAPVPPGVAGELYIAGDGIAAGYLNRPRLTADKFIQNPFNKEQRMYRSGDSARWLANGIIEFLGRIDGQVKIRG
ncbi:MAG: AMP-binding protein, partial [bacterium]|nr:AMP-binding protein [bacterium]